MTIISILGVIIGTILFTTASVVYWKNEISPRRKEWKVLCAKLELLDKEDWPNRYLLMKKHSFKWQDDDMTIEEIYKEYEDIKREHDYYLRMKSEIAKMNK